ncbi:MAG: YIP1 family protein [Limnochordia bacterium]
MVKRWLWVATVLAVAVAAATCIMPGAEARRIGLYFQQGIGIFPSQLGYVYHRDFGLELEMDGPQDMFLSHDKTLYLVDTGNNRILKVDMFGELLAEFGKGPDLEMEHRLKKPQGVFVNEFDEVIVADTDNKRIVIYNPDGTMQKIIPQPDSVLLGEDFHYQPTKVIQDRRGYLYVANSNDYRGLILLDTNGAFRGFFAPNRVPFSMRRIIINMFATEAQKEKLSKTLPTPHSNMIIDQYGYIYSSTVYDRKNQIKKLNSVGKDVLNSSDYVYGYTFRRGSQYVQPNFVDLTVNEKGIMSALDSQNGWIYQYDQDRNLLLMFGGKGEEKGYFGYPTSIVGDDEGYLYILDKDRNNIQVFRPTQFAGLVHGASELYVDGRYEEAAGPWREVIKYNTNYSLAWSGIGKAFMKLEEYDKALQAYHYARDREGYSEAFAELRHAWVRSNFGLNVTLIIALIFAIAGAIKGLQWIYRQPWEESGIVVRTVQTLLKVMFRPAEGFWDLKVGKKGNPLVGAVLMILMFAVRVFDIQCKSYQIASVDPKDVSLFLEIARIFGVWIVWGVANYGVGAIFEGEGFFRDVMTAAAYSMGPYLLFTWPLTLFSHVLTRAEKGYIDFFFNIIVYWSLALVILSVRHVHNFNFRVTVTTTALSVFGMFIIVGVLGLMWVLTDQLVTFIQEMVVEIAIRA